MPSSLPYCIPEHGLEVAPVLACILQICHVERGRTPESKHPATGTPIAAVDRPQAREQLQPDLATINAYNGRYGFPTVA